MWEQQLKQLVLSGSCSTYAYSLKCSACYQHNRGWTPAIHKVDDSHKHQAMSYILSVGFSQDTFCFPTSQKRTCFLNINFFLWNRIPLFWPNLAIIHIIFTLNEELICFLAQCSFLNWQTGIYHHGINYCITF